MNNKSRRANCSNHVQIELMGVRAGGVVLRGEDEKGEKGCSLTRTGYRLGGDENKTRRKQGDKERQGPPLLRRGAGEVVPRSPPRSPLRLPLGWREWKIP
ncbi:hypothetical protein QVD17_38454 [Tagetes erecta]|uniref:Uncharacterized protein n=1 Tax=Tagetes erecta TaxID=13708 RepID=A0AAD8NG87_TARER|nr:hypothetical protein QVD17_38454 [Tagetes erecta]